MTESKTSEHAESISPAAADTSENQTAVDTRLQNIPSIGKTIPVKTPTLILMLCVFLAGVIVILWAWRIGPFHSHIEQTENSYIKSNTTILSSQINGYIDEVYVNDFDSVTDGQQLLRISSSNYNQQVVQAQASLVQAENQLANQKQLLEQRRADIVAAQAKIDQIEAQYQLAQLQLRRYEELGNTGAASKTEQDTAKANLKNQLALLKQAQANVRVAEEALKTADVAKIGLEAQIHSANAQLEQAKIMQDYSLITAPIDGRLGQITIHQGQYVAAGSQLMVIVPPEVWIIANFKETQMNHIKTGQKAWFTVDALGGQQFTGEVERISPAAGSEFSVIKADNATGNFTKVVQRISVRIKIDSEQTDLHRLSPGMSVVTSIDTQSR